VDIVRVCDYLDPDEVLSGYTKGIFPMGYADSPVISWHLPEHRGILPLEHFHASRSLLRQIRKGDFRVSFDESFPAVLQACANRGGSRPGQDSWITPKVQEVYTELFHRGYAHSVEVWQDGELAGGTYGIHLGGAFFAESKFHARSGMSKIALYYLVERLRSNGFALLDVQYWTPHLEQFGVIEIDRNEYYWRLREALKIKAKF
jgi:leucyl/phenylalanyl-tRNA--protein transferase